MFALLVHLQANIRSRKRQNWNRNRSGFQNDVYFEIEKFLAHDNKALIFTNIGNNIFDNIEDKSNNTKLLKIIKMPLVEEIYSPSLFDYYFSNFVT